MSKTLRRAALLVLMTMLVCAVAWASGDIDWDTPAAGQNLSGNAAVELLKDYIRRVNETLVSSGAMSCTRRSPALGWTARNSPNTPKSP